MFDALKKYTIYFVVNTFQSTLTIVVYCEKRDLITCGIVQALRVKKLII